ncbi:MAG: tRNA (adenosine(37)-N6)-threonylcarbamoyltransferase complex dimerization subunit type 1 TsaB [Kineosporiaceae bacterium]|nr:tRNA (adenosine(37)-N6)-threonylcarbamoyltransferase complex dimerization subunit type 1 TsaB [Aeromicrobium sp.]
MLLLAFDTATPAITVALHDGERVLASVAGEGSMAHGEWLVPFIAKAVDEAGVTMADLTDIAVGVGPGPFTGLRVGVVTALTLGSTLGLKTHGVCSLDIIASQVDSEVGFLVATDARRKEVYWARYHADGRRVEGPAVLKPADLALIHPSTPAYGRGATQYAEILAVVDGPQDPDAAALAAAVIAGIVEEVPLEPLYLRRPDAVPQVQLKRA